MKRLTPGVVALLARHRAGIAGRVAFIFQPADGPMRGAKRIIDDGSFDRIRPDMSMSVHIMALAALDLLRPPGANEARGSPA